MLKTLRRTNWDWIIPIARGLFIAIVAVVLGQLIAVASTQNGLPFLRERSLVFVFLLVPILLTIVLLLARAEIGFGLIVVFATLAISKTGFQIDLGPVRTSALEMLIVISAPMLLLRMRLFAAPPRWPSLPIGKPLLLFAAGSIPGLLLAAYYSIPWSNVLWEYKGYFLYPLLAYVMVAWITTERRWLAVILVGLLGAAVVAVTGLVAWKSSGAVVSSAVSTDVRVGGVFGVINQYGFYLSSMALLAAGLFMTGRSKLLGIIGASLTLFLIVGMSVSGSRGAWLGLGAGLLLLLLVRRPHWSVWVLIGIGLGAIWFWQLQYFGDRLLRLDDSSALTRVDYAQVAQAVFLKYPLFGAGWGANFMLNMFGDPVSTPGLPWYHNDYLIVLSQIGIFGLALFLLVWTALVTQTLRQLASIKQANLTGPILGALAGVVALLVQASTDQVFERPDTVGQVWWLVGIVLAGLAIAARQQSSRNDSSPVRPAVQLRTNLRESSTGK